MGKVSGDKSRYNRQRRKNLARREEMRALRARLAEAKAGGTPPPKAAPSKSASKASAARPSD